MHLRKLELYGPAVHAVLTWGGIDLPNLDTLHLGFCAASAMFVALSYMSVPKLELLQLIDPKEELISLFSVTENVEPYQEGGVDRST